MIQCIPLLLQLGIEQKQIGIKVKIFLFVITCILIFRIISILSNNETNADQLQKNIKWYNKARKKLSGIIAESITDIYIPYIGMSSFFFFHFFCN